MNSLDILTLSRKEPVTVPSFSTDINVGDVVGIIFVGVFFRGPGAVGGKQDAAVFAAEGQLFHFRPGYRDEPVEQLVFLDRFIIDDRRGGCTK